MDFLKNNWRILLVIFLVFAFIWYQYNLYLKEEEEKKKNQGTDEEGETCTKISFQDFQQKKADYYWAGRNLSQNEIDTIVNKYKITSDGCDYRKAVWRWAYDKVLADGFCEVTEEDVTVSI